MRTSRLMRFLGLSVTLTAIILWVGITTGRAQTPDPQMIEEGARLYADNCAVCHGPDGQGRVGATLAKDWPSIRPELTVRTIIANGIQGSVMPAWSQASGGPLSDEQINSLVAFILSWQTGGVPDLAPRPTFTPYPPITPVPEVEGDPNQGAVLFGENCAVCHGPEGQGRVGATLAKNWAGIRPDLNVRSTIANGIPTSVMPAWSQANGGPLTDDEIDHLTAFVLSLPADTVTQLQTQAQPVPDAPLSWLSGWGGVIVFVVIFGLLIAIALAVQSRRPAE